MVTSLAAWLADQVAEAIRPVSERMARDIASRLRVDITIRFTLED